MPCSDGGYHDAIENVVNKQKVDELTKFLCHACSILELNSLVPKELEVWWENHKEEDLQRLEKEKVERARLENERSQQQYLASVKARLMTQLSPDELKALGIKKP
jgi:hypothetical protein